VVAESVAFSLAIQSLIDLGCALTELRLEIRLTRMRNFSLGNDIDSTGSLIIFVDDRNIVVNRDYLLQ